MLLTTTLLWTFLLAVHVRARPIVEEQSAGNGEAPSLLIGPEGSDPDTVGFFINHSSMNVKNFTRSVNFYRDVFGMRLLYTLQATEHYSITNMGHSSGGNNGTGYESTKTMIDNLTNMKGQIELLYLNVPGAEDLPAATETTQTYSHLGFVAPDILAMQARLESYNVPIHKRSGDPYPATGPASIGAGFDEKQRKMLSDEEFDNINNIQSQLHSTSIFCSDPDGNLLEVRPQEGGGVFKGSY
ncbi:hypothetical protein F5Y18DRAFT_400337 [Xylariaceae sp. FL1019]|nr:hypothetical protein F5Y18DRAFT_400337 [Xylariaceae sp. FL1019]